MKASTRIALALEIIPYLTQHRGITQREVAEHFNITVDDLYSILEIAVCSGVPGYGGGDLIDINIWDDNLEVYTAKGLERPLRLTPAERAAITLALEDVSRIPGLVTITAVHSVLAKLSGQTMANEQSEGLAARQESFPGFAGVIAEACSTKRCLDVTYRKGSDDSLSQRTLYPCCILVKGPHAYLVAWDVDAEGLRTFRIDRFVDACCGEVWEGDSPVTAAEVADYCANARAPHVAKVRIDTRSVWLVDQLGATIVRQDPSGVFADVPYYSLEWLENAALRWGPSLEVLEPSDCTKIVANRASRALSRYT